MEPDPQLAPHKGWKLPCAGCGIMIKDGESGIRVEKYFTGPIKLLKVWHANCFDAKMEEGESI